MMCPRVIICANVRVYYFKTSISIEMSQKSRALGRLLRVQSTISMIYNCLPLSKDVTYHSDSIYPCLHYTFVKHRLHDLINFNNF